MVVWVINCDLLNQYIITSKEWKLFTTDYSCHLYQQFVFGSLEFVPLNLIPWVNPDGLGTFILLRLLNTLLPDNGTDGTTTWVCFRLNIECPRPEIELSSFINTSMPYKSKIISFMDNIVIQYNTGVMIYNLTKQKELIINYEKDDPLLQLNDVYIDQKSRIYVSNSISIMFVSLKKKSFDTLYECETSLIKSFMTISDNFIVFNTKFNDIYILVRKSKESFAECKTVSGDFIPSLLKMVLPQFDLNIYDYSPREDMILK